MGGIETKRKEKRDDEGRLDWIVGEFEVLCVVSVEVVFLLLINRFYDPPTSQNAPRFRFKAIFTLSFPPTPHEKNPTRTSREVW